MKTRVIFITAVVVALAFTLFLVGLPATSVYAQDPPWPDGMPWGKGTPWPTANPLSVGQSWTGGNITTSKPAVAPAATKTHPSPTPTAMPRIPTATSVPPPTAVPPPVAAVEVPPPPPTATPKPLPTNAPAPVANGGTSPQSALDPNGSQTLFPGQVVWYRLGGFNGAGVQLNVWLDASEINGLDMTIFAPNQLDNLSSSGAGRGTRPNSSPERLHWAGGGSYRIFGDWYARVTNSNAAPVEIRLTVDRGSVAPKTDCDSYWEWLQNGNYVYWTACR